MKLPFVKRNVLVDCKQKLIQSETSLSRSEINLSCTEADLETAKKVIQDVLPRLIKINIERSFDSQTYRVCVDIHRDMAERAFIHGGSQKEIEFLAEMIGEQVGRKMIQFNFARCNI